MKRILCGILLLLCAATMAQATTIEFPAGPYPNADGGLGSTRIGKLSELMTADILPQYYEATARGMVYTVSNVAAQAVSVALTTTYTGLVVSNPIGSGYNLAIIGAQYALTVAPAAIASIHLIAGGSSTGVVTHTAVLAAPGIQNAYIGIGAGTTGGSVGSKFLCDSQATIVNPYYLAAVGSGFTAAALYATTPSTCEFKGCFVIGEGGWIAWGALTAVTGFGSFVVMQVPKV